MINDLGDIDDMDGADTRSNDSFDKDSHMTNGNAFENI